jgi:hypothetical protein
LEEAKDAHDQMELRWAGRRQYTHTQKKSSGWMGQRDANKKWLTAMMMADTAALFAAAAQWNVPPRSGAHNCMCTAVAWAYQWSKLARVVAPRLQMSRRSELAFKSLGIGSAALSRVKKIVFCCTSARIQQIC